MKRKAEFFLPKKSDQRKLLFWIRKIAFNEQEIKHVYFVAETKGSLSSMQLRLIEEAKIHCAREHFKAISTEDVKYDVVDDYETLMEMVMK